MNIKKVKLEIKGKEIEIDNKTQRSHIIEIIGDPDDVGGLVQNNKNGQILKYDEIEFHFYNDKEDANLFLIYSETIEGYCKISIPVS
jgi:hypothetical protein